LISSHYGYKLLTVTSNSVVKRMSSTSEHKPSSAHTVKHRITVLTIQRHMNQIPQIEMIETKLGWYARYALRYTIFTCDFFTLLNCEQERSSAKRKELYKTVQVKAAVSPQTQLLLDMKVRWSSTYVMVNRAETSRKVRLEWNIYTYTTN
jgi:hypothetical protein